MQTTLTTKTQTKIKSQQVLTSQLLQIAGAEIEQLIAREVATNPALDRVDEQSRAAAESAQEQQLASAFDGSVAFTGRLYPAGGDFSGAAHGWSQDVAHVPSLAEFLTNQLTLMVEGIMLEVATYLVHCLDDRGYLRESSEALADDLGIDRLTVERAIKILQDLEPPGIGARNVRECLLIQCTHLENEGIDCTQARRALMEAWDELSSQRWSRAARKLQMSQANIERVRDFIANNLYPHPVLLFDSPQDRAAQYRWVDLIAYRRVGDRQPRYAVDLPGEEAFALRISDMFHHALQKGPSLAVNLTAEDRAWIKTHVDRAQLFILALDQRWATLRRVGEYIVNYQADFLDHGPLSIKPLTRAAVAQELGLHESTVSRAVNHKTIQLPSARIVQLGDFFDSSLAVKETIRQVMSGNSKVLSDRELAEQLRARGFSLARRTVTKYRNQLKLPSSHGRH